MKMISIVFAVFVVGVLLISACSKEAVKTPSGVPAAQPNSNQGANAAGNAAAQDITSGLDGSLEQVDSEFPPDVGVNESDLDLGI
jgi:hypothetical protein